MEFAISGLSNAFVSHYYKNSINLRLTVLLTYIHEVTVLPFIDIRASDGVVKYVNL